ncbi:MAG: MrcB family domain-containing protein [Candidatus Nanohaloarchaea archaeon]
MAGLGRKDLEKKILEETEEHERPELHFESSWKDIDQMAGSVMKNSHNLALKDYQTAVDVLFEFKRRKDFISKNFDEKNWNTFHNHSMEETLFIGFTSLKMQEEIGEGFSPHAFNEIKGHLHSENKIPTSLLIKEVMARYPRNQRERFDKSFGNDAVEVQLLKKLERRIRKQIGDLEGLTTHVSGQGTWPSTPWIGIMDKRITESAKRGTYIVFFIDPRDNKFYLTIGQGTSELTTPFTNKTKRETLIRRAERIADQIDIEGFQEGGMDLNTDSQTDKFYPPSTALYKEWSFDNLPSGKELSEDFLNLLQKYRKWINSWEDPKDYLIFNPDAEPRKVVGSPDHFITSAERRCWGFENISDNITEGDVVIIHASSKSKHSDLKNMKTGLIGVGIVEEGIENYKDEPWWLAEFTSDDEWPDILKFKKLFLTGDTQKLDLSRNVYQKFKEDKEILNQEMEALLENSVGREKADEIAQEVNQEDKGFPWRVNGGRFLDANDNPCYELPIKIFEEMKKQ